MSRTAAIVLLFLLLLNTSACATFSYYAQSITGHMALLSKRQSISYTISNPDTREHIKRKLERINEVLDYAAQNLLLPVNNSYRSYADIGRDYVVWNVFATPEFSFQPKKWCYLFAGCLSYRGYFSKKDAQDYAGVLEQQGLDIFIGGVTAYSTLGWFDDPVLSTMLKWDQTRLARVIFHELAHRLVYINNDTEFNEAFADSVAQIGVQSWLQASETREEVTQFEQKLQRENEFVDLVLKFRKELSDLYDKDLAEVIKRKQKNRLFEQMQEDYYQIRKTWHTDDAYDEWFKSGLNNAKLAAVSIYRKYVPGFLALLNSVNNDLQKFYDAVVTLEKCNPSIRHRILEARLTEYDC